MRRFFWQLVLKTPQRSAPCLWRRLSTLDVPLAHDLARSTALFGMTRGFVETRAFQPELVDELLKLLWAHLGGNAGYEALDQRQPFGERHRVCVIDELADGRMVE